MPRGYVLNAGEGRSYDWRGHFITLKAAAAETGGGLAVWEFITKKGEEPNDHVHHDVDEVFSVLKGSLTIRCGDDEFQVSDGGFVYLPRGLRHGYTIHNEGPVRFLALSIPSDFGDHVESTGTRLSDADAKARFDSLLGEQTRGRG